MLGFLKNTTKQIEKKYMREHENRRVCKRHVQET